MHQILAPLRFDIFCLRHKFLVYNLLSRNLKLRYRQSALGILWSIIIPLLNSLLFYFVFVKIVNIQIPHYLPFILIGIFPWTFLSTVVLDSVDSLQGNEHLISRIPLPIQVFPLVTNLTAMTNLFLSLPVLFVFMFFSDLTPAWPYLVLPYLLLLLFCVTYGLSLLVSVAVVYFKDIRNLIPVLMQAWFYATPIFYDEKMIPARLSWVLHLNPVGHFFGCIRQVLIAEEWPDLPRVMIATAWALFLLMFGVTVYLVAGKRVPEII